MSKEHNVAVLNCLYQNSCMAEKCIQHINEISKDEAFKACINKQCQKYTTDCKALEKEIKNLGGVPAKIPTMDKMMATMGIAKEGVGITLGSTDSTSKLAQMMYQGTQMGIADATKTINSATNADCAVIEKTKALLITEQNYANELKKFL